MSHHDYIPDSIALEGEANDVPEALGSWVLNLLWILVEIRGAPVLRFIENFRLMNDIVPRFARSCGGVLFVWCPHCKELLLERNTGGLMSEDQKCEKQNALA